MLATSVRRGHFAMFALFIGLVLCFAMPATALADDQTAGVFTTNQGAPTSTLLQTAEVPTPNQVAPSTPSQTAEPSTPTPTPVELVCQKMTMSPYGVIEITDVDPGEFAIDVDPGEFATDEEGLRTQASAVTQSEAIEIVKSGLENHQETISFTINTDANFADYAWPLLLQAFEDDDNPLHGDYMYQGYEGSRVTMSGTSLGSVYTMTYTYKVNYKITLEQDQATLAAAKSALAELHRTRTMNTEEEKTRAIYDYICSHVTYDHAHLGDDSYQLQFTAYAALMHGTAVCAGYSQLFYLMGKLEGLSTRYIVGNDGDHAWNIVRIGSYYYNIDATWDCERYEADVDYEFYLKNDSEFKDHVRLNVDPFYYGSVGFYEKHPMSPVSYMFPQVTQGDITYTISGGEATATTYYGQNGQVNIPATIDGYPVTAIGASFAGSSSAITSVSIPASVRVIRHMAFGKCPNLQEVRIANGVKVIGNYAFFNCYSWNFTKIAIPASVTRIGEKAFAGCFSLGNVSLSDGLQTICSEAFRDCSALNTVTIPKTVNAMGQDAFAELASNSTVQFDSKCLLNKLKASTGVSYVTASKTTMVASANAVDHSWKVTSDVKPTCTTAGNLSRTCVGCGVTEAQTLDALGHSWSAGVVGRAATCEAEGEVVYTCERDASHTRTEVLPALGHAWDEGVVTRAATCVSEGVRTFTCTHDASHTRTEVLPAAGHAWDEGIVTKPATCEAEGVRTFTCAHDASHVRTEALPATGHSWNNGAVTKAATCTEEGVVTFTCANDSTHKRTEALPVLGHAWDSGTVTTPATCEAGGVRTFTCMHDASHTRTEALPATGHTWGEWTVTVEPTRESEGTEVRVCAVCGSSEQRAIPALSSGDISDATIRGIIDKTYTGEAIEQAIDVTYAGAKLQEGKDYLLAYENNVNAGEAKAVLTGIGAYNGTKAATFEIRPAMNIMMVSKYYLSKTVKAKALKKKAKKVALPSVTAAFGASTVTWKIESKDALGVLKLKGSKVVVKKGAAKGSYMITAKPYIPATSNYSAASTSHVTIAVRVK